MTITHLRTCQKDKLFQLIRYGISGIGTILFNVGIYALFKCFLDYRVANFLCIILTKVFAYFTNKFFVFKTKTQLKEQAYEFTRFLLARGFTGIIDFFGQIILVEFFSIQDMFAKCLMIILVTILNYFISSYAVFKKSDQKF